VTLAPNAALAAATTYSAHSRGAQDLAGNVMTAMNWSFTTSGVAACPCSIWSSSTAPGTTGDHGRERASKSGLSSRRHRRLIYGVRFYKGTTNTGIHTGSVWSTAGTLLATATFQNESASGCSR